jgi:TonB family protein
MVKGKKAPAAGPRTAQKPSRRGVPRFHVQVPLDVTILRSGFPDTVPGRSINLGERGIGAVLATELRAGESVGIEFQLPLVNGLLRTRALVRHQDKLRCGLEFIGLSPEQQTMIRQWTRQPQAVMETGARRFIDSVGAGVAQATPANVKSRPLKSRRRLWLAFAVLAAMLACVWTWHWKKDWRELEAGLPGAARNSTQEPRTKVPSEVMERLILHRVDPEYPEAARQAKLESVVVLDVIVGRDGSVTDMHAVSGPDVLMRAAMDCVRWWRFQPYLVNGEPVVVETTFAVDFRGNAAATGTTKN